MKTYTVKVGNNGSRFWYNADGKLHRTDGPAVERADGRRVWYVNGRLHCEDGPAVEWANGDRAWYQNGRLHREDGPAVENADGTQSWWIDGTHLTEQEFNDRQSVSEMKLSEVEALLGKKIKIISE